MTVVHPSLAARALDLPALPLTLLDVTARALGDTALPPYLGATLRGALGTALRAASCSTGAPTCGGCPHLATCAYGATWEGGAVDPARHGGHLVRGSDPPKPYVLSWRRSLQPRGVRVPRGETLSFRLALAGSARSALPFYLLALRDALRGGLGRARQPLELVEVVSRGPDRAPLTLYAGGDVRSWAALPEDTLAGHAEQVARHLGPGVRLELRTPLELTSEGRALDALRLDVLVRRLTERIDRLVLAWGDGGAALLDHEVLAGLAAEVRVQRADVRSVGFERRSRRAEKGVPMRGLVGWIELGDVHPALGRLLAAGSLVHVGKHATFGFGRIEPRPLRSDGSGRGR